MILRLLNPMIKINIAKYKYLPIAGGRFNID